MRQTSSRETDIMFRKTALKLGLATTLLGSVAVFLVLTAVSAGAQKTQKAAGGGSGTFTVTGSMNIPRFLHRAVLLNTGLGTTTAKSWGL
jgi:hypothetical protein